MMLSLDGQRVTDLRLGHSFGARSKLKMDVAIRGVPSPPAGPISIAVLPVLPVLRQEQPQNDKDVYWHTHALGTSGLLIKQTLQPGNGCVNEHICWWSASPSESIHSQTISCDELANILWYVDDLLKT